MRFNRLQVGLLICQFELKRAFKTKKGLLSLVTFFLVWYFVLRYPIRYAADFLSHQDNLMFGGRVLELIGLPELFQWKVPELGVYWHVSLVLFPLLVIMTAGNQTCADKERGTLRFLCLRVSRGSIFFGRFLGVIIIQILLIAFTLLSAVMLAIYRDGSLIYEAFNSSAAVIINLVIALLPFAALMAALSVSVKSGRLATVWAILIWSFLTGVIGLLSSYLPSIIFLNIFIPGYQLSELSHLIGWQALQLAYIPLLQSAVLLSLGYWMMSRQKL